MKKNGRENLIAILVRDSINTVESGEATDFLTSIFRDGFRGYDDLSDEELFEEADSKGLNKC